MITNYTTVLYIRNMIAFKVYNQLNLLIRLKRILKNKKTLPASGNSFSVDKENNDAKKFVNPGKIFLSDAEIEKKEKRLKVLSEEWKQQKIEEENYKKRMIGFSKIPETLNGRLAMLFLIIGLLTEYWTKQSIPNQIELMFRIIGIL